MIIELSSAGLDEQEIGTLEENILKARKKLLSRPRIHVDALMNDALAALRRLESRIRFQAEAQTTVSVQGFWGCFLAVATAVAAAVATATTCSACAADPTKTLTCVGCGASAILTIAAVGFIASDESPC